MVEKTTRGRGRPFVMNWATDDTAEALHAAYRTERDVAVQPRLHALWLLRDGTRRVGEVARLLGVNYRTVQRWVAWYRQGGLAAVRAHHLGGPGMAAWLTPEQQEQVAQEVATGRFHNAVEIRAWVEATFGVRYTEGGMYSLLERLQCAPKIPRPVHEKANQAAQAVWKKGG